MSLENICLCFMFCRLYSGPIFVAQFLKNPVYRDLLKYKLESNESFNDFETSIEKVLHEPNSALIFDESYVKNKIKKYQCKYKVYC